MRSLLLLTVLLGVALAKPNEAQMKKLTGLLKRLLEKKDGDDGSSESGLGSGTGSGSGSGYGSGVWPPPELSIDTTLFEGLGEENAPFKLFGGLIDADFTEPLEISQETSEKYFDDVKKVADAISGIASQIRQNLNDFVANNDPASLSLSDIGQFASEKLEPLFYDPSANLEPHMGGTMVALIQGAVAGTEGAERDEKGCDFDGEDDELLECILNKMFLITWASEIAVEQAQFLLEADLDGSGEGIRMCDQLFNYVMKTKMEGNELEGAKFMGAFKATLMCMGDNIELIRDRIGVRAPEAFPGEFDSMLPLPALLKTQAFMQHVGAQAYWAMETVYAAMYAPDLKREGHSVLNQKVLAEKKKMARNRFLSHTAKAYSRNYNIMTRK